MEWRDIPEENCRNYEVSCEGDVRNKKTGKILKPYIREGGYKKVNLGKKTYLIHRLVGLAFIPNPDNKPTIDHIDRNTSNNKLSNLRWATVDENCQNKNTTNYANITIVSTGYRVLFRQASGKNHKYDKNFPTLLEAIKARDNFLSTLS